MSMRMMMIALAAVLLASPLTAQAGAGAGTADAWRRMRALDPRLRVEFAAAPAGDAGAAEWRMRMGLPGWVLLGARSDALPAPS
jgi:hypothetical protein